LKTSKGIQNDILLSLLQDPTRSDSEIASALGIYRQKVWRERKRLEEEKVIWGYTAVVDESQLDRIEYLYLVKTNPLSKETVDRIYHRQPQKRWEPYDVRIINTMYLNGEYDWLIHFSAPDRKTGKRYYEFNRQNRDNSQERPLLLEVSHPLWKEGKRTPTLGGLRQFLPIADSTQTVNEPDTEKPSFSMKSKVLLSLLENPTLSDSEIASTTDIYRQKIWVEKKRLEKENVIWGYTAVIDESKLDRMEYIFLSKNVAMCEEYLKRLKEDRDGENWEQYGVRIINMLYLNGEYDLLLHFSVPDTRTAKRFYEYMRQTYDEFCLEKPLMVEVSLPLWKEGKMTPIPDGLRSFLPMD
jgi:DNA-binding Lrp family transcriptional regulator